MQSSRRPIGNLALALSVLAAASLPGAPSLAGASSAALAAAPAPRPGVGARTGGVRAGVRAIQPNPRAADTRSQVVEGSLRDINRSLDASRPGPVNLPRPADCPGCATRADLKLEASAAESERALRSSLHRLRRETRIARNPDERRNQAEDALDRSQQP